MLWFLVLPFLLTVGFITFTVVTASVFLPKWPWWHRRDWGRIRACVLCSILGFVLFIPTCIGVTAAIHPLRFGTFTYETASDVGDSKVSNYLPPEAREITVRTGVNGHVATYRVDRQDLEKHIETLWKIARPDAIDLAETGELSRVDLSGFDLQLPGELGPLSLPSPGPEPMHVYTSPFAPNGAGCFYYLEPEGDRVLHRVGYW